MMGLTNIHAQVIKVPTHEGSKDPWSGLYSRKSKSTQSGVVVGIQIMKRADTHERFETLLLNSKGTTRLVELGPEWYVKAQSTKIKLDDTVKVVGVKTSLNGIDTIVASLVQVHQQGGPVIALRKLDGHAYWEERVTLPKIAQNVDNGIPIYSDATPEVYNGPSIYGERVISSPNGELQIDTGPEWFLYPSNYEIKVGNNITVVVGPGVFTIGPRGRIY